MPKSWEQRGGKRVKLPEMKNMVRTTQIANSGLMLPRTSRLPARNVYCRKYVRGYLADQKDEVDLFEGVPFVAGAPEDPPYSIEQRVDASHVR